jgi:hypothetical protein
MISEITYEMGAEGNTNVLLSDNDVSRDPVKSSTLSPASPHNTAKYVLFSVSFAFNNLAPFVLANLT